MWDGASYCASPSRKLWSAGTGGVVLVVSMLWQPMQLESAWTKVYSTVLASTAGVPPGLMPVGHWVLISW